MNSDVTHDDALRERIQAYRDSLGGEKPDLDIALLFRILDLVNDLSEVRVAVDPVDDHGGWQPGAPTWSVTGVRKLDDGRVVLRVADEHHGIKAGDFYAKLEKEFEHQTGAGVPVLFARGDSVTKLTDVYSHALVHQMWAGMPFDLVLAVRSKDL